MRVSASFQIISCSVGRPWLGYRVRVRTPRRDGSAGEMSRGIYLKGMSRWKCPTRGVEFATYQLPAVGRGMTFAAAGITCLGCDILMWLASD